MQKLLIVSLFLSALSSSSSGQQAQLIDKKATVETRALFHNFMKLSERHTLFGHQHAAEYGHGWKGDIKSPTHYYAPFSGHASVPNFMKFYDDPYTLFENDLRAIYK